MTVRRHVATQPQAVRRQKQADPEKEARDDAKRKARPALPCHDTMPPHSLRACGWGRSGRAPPGRAGPWGALRCTTLGSSAAEAPSPAEARGLWRAARATISRVLIARGTRGLNHLTHGPRALSASAFSRRARYGTGTYRNSAAAPAWIMHQRGLSSSNPDDDASDAQAEEQFISPLEVLRQKYQKKKHRSTDRQKDTLARLASFKSSLLSLGPVEEEEEQAGEKEEEQEEEGKKEEGKEEERKDDDVGREGDYGGHTREGETAGAKLMDMLDVGDEAGVSWKALGSTSLKFTKTLEERRSEIRRDNDYDSYDPLAEKGEADVDLTKTQHKRRLAGETSRRALDEDDGGGGGGGGGAWGASRGGRGP